MVVYGFVFMVLGTEPRAFPLSPAYFIFYFDTRSQKTLSCQAELKFVILLLQPLRVVGLHVCATMLS